MTDFPRHRSPPRGTRPPPSSGGERQEVGTHHPGPVVPQEVGTARCRPRCTPSPPPWASVPHINAHCKSETAAKPLRIHQYCGTLFGEWLCMSACVITV
eukprot:5869284-Prymnesium_polylepis.1